MPIDIPKVLEIHDPINQAIEVADDSFIKPDLLVREQIGLDSHQVSVVKEVVSIFLYLLADRSVNSFRLLNELLRREIIVNQVSKCLDSLRMRLLLIHSCRHFAIEHLLESHGSLISVDFRKRQVKTDKLSERIEFCSLLEKLSFRENAFDT